MEESLSRNQFHILDRRLLGKILQHATFNDVDFPAKGSLERVGYRELIEITDLDMRIILNQQIDITSMFGVTTGEGSKQSCSFYHAVLPYKLS